MGLASGARKITIKLQVTINVETEDVGEELEELRGPKQVLGLPNNPRYLQSAIRGTPMDP